MQEPLSRWVFRRREEDQERLAQRRELAQQGERRLAQEPAGATGGILLVGGEPELEEALREVLRPIQPMTRIVQSAQALKDALADPPRPWRSSA